MDPFDQGKEDHLAGAPYRVYQYPIDNQQYIAGRRAAAAEIAVETVDFIRNSLAHRDWLLEQEES